MNIKECEYALNLLRNRNYQLVQQLTCGFSGEIPLVCCQQFSRNVNGDGATDTTRGNTGATPEIPPSPTPPTIVTVPPSRVTETPATRRTTAPPVTTTAASQSNSKLPSPPHCGLSNITNYKVVGGIPAKART